MRYFALLILNLVCTLLVAQKVQEIELIHADRLKVDESTPDGASKLIGHVQLRQKDVMMYCDSALLYETNMLKAYGHVRIVEGDSMELRGDSLSYNGNTKLAKVRGNVTIDNKSSLLKTNFLDYDRNAGVAHYFGGGEIDSRKEKIHLTSKHGHYFPESKLFHFKGNVVMKHPDYVIKTDTMHYAPKREKTWFYGPTNIISDDRDIYCERGWFDQLTEQARFEQNARIKTTGQILEGDTIIFDDKKGIGEAFCHVRIIDVNEKFEVNGDYAINYKKDSTSLVTQNVMLKQDMAGDTFFLVCDTLHTNQDSLGNRMIFTYHQVLFYKSDMQGQCDSMKYSGVDSTIHLYRDPILWSDENQLEADSIYMLLHNETLDKMYMNHNAFIISLERDILFNQIKGRKMLGYFKEGSLKKVDVFGNGETIYYPREEDQTLIGVNETQCSDMTIFIDSNEIKKISFFSKPNAKLTPSDDMPKAGKKLNGFSWRPENRPRSADDLWVKRRQMLVSASESRPDATQANSRASSAQR